MWLTLLMDIRVWLGAALVATGIYAKVQTVRMEEAKAEYAQFRADVESEAAKAKVVAAQEATRQAQAAQEVLSDLQTRNDALSTRYERLRRDSARSSPVSAVPGTATSPSPVASSPVESDADARCVAVLEQADKELAKFRELWELQLRNAGLSRGI
jgi:hypothetical protein